MNKTLHKGDFTWKEFLAIIMVPVCGTIYAQVAGLRSDLYNFKVEVATSYVHNSRLDKLEEKLDRISEQISNLSVKVAVR